MADVCRVGDVAIGPGAPLTIIAGPCVLESDDVQWAICDRIGAICEDLGLPWIFKASFDKANRTSIASQRGPGIEQGLETLAAIKDRIGVPITSDIHAPEQAAPAAEVLDVLQIPAFLCRQTDLLAACGATGRPVNIKKGQFLPPAEMQHAATKALDAGADGIILTERGTFFGYNRLVTDFIGLGDMADLGWPICFDVTHSTQLPGGGGAGSGGRPERAGMLARAAVAAGVHALFLEVHPNPAQAHSDAATVQPLDAAEQIIRDAHAIHTTLAQRHAGVLDA